MSFPIWIFKRLPYVLEGADNWELVAKMQDNHGLTAIDAAYCDTPAEPETTATALDISTLALDDKCDTVIIEMPKSDFTDHDIVKIENLVKSKATLIKKSLGVDTLTIEKTDETLRFPWFTGENVADKIAIFSHFISALCTTAKKQVRAGATEKEVENEKYTFRCFLLKLGFIGAEYSELRKTLLANLSGDAAFKNKPNRRQSTTAEA